ncbi:hypothetical protein Pint_05221 [Pistacia integerrima]|uniref:Uncharacterized protein n=1 Tax=Pistacia integerrima TaxID=434235 RepID=A0ACC0Z405_9ROSI|nr:hypothetical protein Pint_05221 [Pistacia integerrima]
MDVLGVHHQIIKSKKHRNKRSKKGIKVVYISSPMKVNTCASNFRALVQELTGKDSDVDASASRFVENPNPNKLVDDQDAVGSDHLMGLLNMELVDDVFMPHREGSFLGMFTSNFFSDLPFQFNHPIRSFDSV